MATRESTRWLSDGSGQRRLTKGSDRETNPSYLPNGELVFVTEKGGGSRIHRLPAGTTQPVTVLETSQPVVSLDVSRDGNRVAYTDGKARRAGQEDEAGADDSGTGSPKHPLTGAAASWRADPERLVLTGLGR